MIHKNIPDITIDDKRKPAMKPTIIRTLLLASATAMFGSPLLVQSNVQQGQASDEKPTFGNVKYEGDYKYHLQGVCTNERDAVFWSFTTDLVKTDRRGRVQKKVAVANHHGDLCFSDGKLYITVNLDRFNNPNSNADSWVCVYKADTLKLLA